MLRITDDITNDQIKEMLKDTDSGEISSIQSSAQFARYVESRLEVWTRRFNCTPYDSRILDDMETRCAFEQLYYSLASTTDTGITDFDSIWDRLLKTANSAYILNRAFTDVKRFAVQKENWPNFMRILFVAMFVRIVIKPNTTAVAARNEAREESRKKSLRESQAKLRTTQKNTYANLMREMDAVERLISKIDVQIAELQAKRAESVDARTQIQARIDRWGPESVSE